MNNRYILSIIAILLFSAGVALSQEEERVGIPGIPGLERSVKKAGLASDIDIVQLDEGLEYLDLIQELMGEGVTVSNISYTGATAASGIFTNAVSTGIDIESGVILSSGWAKSIIGPNNVASTSNNNDLPGDADLTSIIGSATFDAAVLEFDFIPTTPVITFNYVLLSEEYPEYLNFTDVFAFIVNGENIALIPGTFTEVSIGTINHITNSEYYRSNETGAYNLQADGFTVILTATANVMVGVTNHIKLAVADQGDHIYDSWVFLEGSSFTSKGSIIGKLLDINTGNPIQGGTVVATGDYVGHGFSDVEGNYKILQLQFGYGYTVTASAQGYDVATVEDINVLESNPQIIQDIYLVPGESDYEIVELKADPNPVISYVMPEGVVHRYYHVVSKSTGKSASNVLVGIESSYASLTPPRISDQYGIVDVAIPASAIGGGQPGDSDVFSITYLGNALVEEPVSFEAYVVAPEYSKAWFANKQTEGSVSILNVEKWKGSYTELVEYSDGNEGPEISLMSDLAKVGIGATASLSAYAQLTITDAVDFKPGGSVGVTGMAFLGGADNFTFNYDIQDQWQATSQTLLILEGNIDLIDASLTKLLLNIQKWFTDKESLDNSYTSSSLTLEKYGHGYIKADLMNGLLGPPLPVRFDIDISVGAESHSKMEYSYFKHENKFSRGLDWTGRLYTDDGSGGIIIDFPIPEEGGINWSGGFKELFSIEDKASSRTLGVKYIENNGQMETILLKSGRRSFSNGKGWEEVLQYEINGEDAMELLSSWLEVYLNVMLGNVYFNDLLETVFSGLYDLQTDKGGNASIKYRKTRSELKSLDQFSVKLGAGLTSVFSASVGSGTYLEESRSKLIESGKWAFGRHYPSQTYNTMVPDIDITYQEYIQYLADALPGVLKTTLGVLNVIPAPGFKKSTQEQILYDIGDNGATLLIDPVVIPVGIDSIYCVSWSWYGDAPSRKSADISQDNLKSYIESVRKKSEETQQMVYGIGGFYQFEPYGTLLNGSATLTLTYSDDEIAGLEESKLAVYSENKEEHKYEYIGGIVDALNNTITVDINELSLFTIGPAVPSGPFELIADKDTLYITGQDTVHVGSGFILMNNTDTVGETLFTIDYTLGKILDEDVDPLTDGLQLLSQAGKLNFSVVPDGAGGNNHIGVKSLIGDAVSLVSMFFADTIPPGAPELLTAVGVNETIGLCWKLKEELDISGYKIYFDNDTAAPPFEGIAKITGKNSPVLIGKDTSYTITGLFADSGYYVAITAIDIMGNESDYSDILYTGIAVNQLPVIHNQELTFEGACNNGTVLGFLMAEDPDSLQELSYLISGGAYAHHFAFDTASGEVRLVTSAEPFTSQERIIVRARDNGPGTLYDEAYLVCNLVCDTNPAPDVSDTTFTLYYADLHDGLMVGSILIKDPDPMQQVTYQLRNPYPGIHLDEASGMITIVDSSEIQIAEDEFRLSVIARDNGNGWESDTSLVRIMFDRSFVKDTIQEVIFSGQCNQLAQVGIMETRPPMPGETIAFSMQSAEQAGRFTMDSITGAVYLQTGTSPFGQEETIKVRIEDTGPAQTVNEITLVMQLGCQANHPPVAMDTLIEFFFSNLINGEVLWQADAYEDDADQVLSYSLITDYPGLSINSETGEITLIDKDLLMPENNELDVYFIVMDNGEGWLTDTGTMSLVLETTRIREKEKQSSFEIFPNPSKGELFISPVEEVSDRVDLKIFSVTGNLIYHESIYFSVGTTCRISTGHLYPGLYLLQIVSDGILDQHRFIKE